MLRGLFDGGIDLDRGGIKARKAVDGMGVVRE